MKALESQIIFLTIFFTSSVQNELKPDAKNVCLHSETYEETILVQIRKPVTEIKKFKCRKIFKSCEKRVTTWKVVNEPRVVQKSRDVLKCCSGYKEIREEVTKCLPLCPTGCVHGECTAPDQCTCRSGFQGRACDQGLPLNAATTKPTAKTNPVEEPSQNVSVTTATTKPTAKTNPVEEPSVQEIFQATEESKLENLNLMSVILKITNTDFVTVAPDESTTEDTFTMIDEISSEVSTTELDEKETLTGTTRETEEVELNTTASVMASTEELRMDVNYNNLMEEEIGLRNGFSNSEGNEASTILESPKNVLGSDFICLLYLLPASGFLLVIASCIVVKCRKKTREAHVEKQRPPKPIQFSMKKFCKKPLRNSESTFSMWEAEPKTLDSVTLGLSVYHQTESANNALDAEWDKAMLVLPSVKVCDQSPAVHSSTTCI